MLRFYMEESTINGKGWSNQGEERKQRYCDAQEVTSTFGQPSIRDTTKG